MIAVGALLDPKGFEGHDDVVVIQPPSVDMLENGKGRHVGAIGS